MLNKYNISLCKAQKDRHGYTVVITFRKDKHGYTMANTFNWSCYLLPPQ